jgi:hypothetical protein
MNKKLEVAEFSDDEIARRRDELAKRMMNMQPKPLKPKPKDGTKASPAEKRGRQNQDQTRPEAPTGAPPIRE